MPSAATRQRVTFDSGDSSDSDVETRDTGNGALAQEMMRAAERERRKNPHAECGRAKLPRTHPLVSVNAAAAKAPPSSAPGKVRKMDLFDSSSSSSDEDEGPRGASSAEKKGKKSLHEDFATASRKPMAQNTAHVKGLSIRTVVESDTPLSHRVADGSINLHSNDEDEEENVLHINKTFASRYEEQKRKQELHTLAEKYKGKLGKAAFLGSDDDEESETDSDDDDDDDEAVLLTRENNLSFAKALLAVRKATVPLQSINGGRKEKSAVGRDTAPPAASKADDPETAPAVTTSLNSCDVLLPKEELLKQTFFPPAEEQIRVNTDVFERRMERKRLKEARGRGFTLSDEYKRALKATAMSEEAVVDAGDEENGERDGLRKLRPQNPEEAKLRAAFLRDVEGSTNAFEVVRSTERPTTLDAGEEEQEGDSDEQLRSAREEERRLLQEAFDLTTSAAKGGKGNTSSPAAGGNEGGDDEVFLRDFFIQELWRPGAGRAKGSAQHPSEDGNASSEDEAGKGGVGSYYERLAQLSREEEDEAFYNDAEAWEREFQEKKYRHQEMEEAATGGESTAHVQTFPRPIGDAATGLLRKPDTARKDARQRRRERAEAARERQIEELKRLKHLKRKEIEDQRALIASVAGLTASSRGGFRGDAAEEAELAKLKAVWSDKDLDTPFDAAEFDRKMAQLFDEDYYDEKNVDEDEIAYFDEELDKEDDIGEGDAAAAALRAGAAPALFTATSLEDAQAMMPPAAPLKATKRKANPELFFDDAFGPASETSSDAVALLYPTEALKRLQMEREQVSELLASSSSSPDGQSKDETNTELLERLQASLKQREEEYYQLHRDAAASADGVSGGSLRGGFRYREVPPEDFTLSIEEILALDDRQLNMIAPMNCYAAYLDKDSNERDRRRVERRREKGFRQVDSERTSRRYGDVKSTALLNPEQIDEEEGRKIAENLSKRLREEGEDPEVLAGEPAYMRGRGRGGIYTGHSSTHHSSSEHKWPRTEGSGRGGHARWRGRGSFSASASGNSGHYRGGRVGRGGGRH